jgi:hypothetical protein
MVYVQNTDRTPLMPCTNVIARLLLKDRRAKVVHRTPFTIRLTSAPATVATQSITLGIDTGSGTIGSAAVNSHGDVLYRSEVTVRNDITATLTQRRQYRRNRRTRKCRYRACRFLNRKHSIAKGRIPPTIRSKVDAHLREMNFIKTILPITQVISEGSAFDPHALADPSVHTDPLKYQHGPQYGFYNVKAFVLHRDSHTCQHCKGTSKDPKLHVHHITFRSNGGSDVPTNIVTICKTCHDAVHRGEITLRKIGTKKTLLHATQMNVIVSQLQHRGIAVCTFGYITKVDREVLGLPKSHSNDAAVIASRGYAINFGASRLLLKKCVAKGDYQQTKGIRGEQRIPTGKIHGFRKFDKVRYRGGTYFIKGRMSTGYAILMDIHGEKQALKPIPKFGKMRRIGSRRSWLLME